MGKSPAWYRHERCRKVGAGGVGGRQGTCGDWSGARGGARGRPFGGSRRPGTTPPLDVGRAGDASSDEAGSELGAASHELSIPSGVQAPPGPPVHTYMAEDEVIGKRGSGDSDDEIPT